MNLKTSIVATLTGSLVGATAFVGMGLALGDHPEPKTWHTVTTMTGTQAMNSPVLHLSGEVRVTFAFDTSDESYNSVYFLNADTTLDNYKGYPIIESDGSAQQDTEFVVSEGDYYFNAETSDGAFSIAVEAKS